MIQQDALHDNLNKYKFSKTKFNYHLVHHLQDINISFQNKSLVNVPQ